MSTLYHSDSKRQHSDAHVYTGFTKRHARACTLGDAVYRRRVSLPIDPQTEGARQRVGRALALARRRARLDQAAVCKSLGTARPTVSAWETGRRTPDVVTAGLLADLYGLTIDQLVGRAPLPPVA